MIDYREFDKNFNLDGKNALITGGAKGIGRAIATLYAEKGANIGILDIADEEGQYVVEDLSRRFGIHSEYFHTDLLKTESIQNSVDKAEDSFQALDILVNNAGVVFLDDAESLSERDWDLTMGVNMRAVFLVSQIVGRKMIANGCGKIVNMASQAGVIALDKHIAYCAAKAAVISMTKVLAYEWAEFGINVNAISPTIVLTELGKKAWGGEKGEAMKKQIPNQRFAYPDEIAAVAVFLASDAAAMINGENLMVDGGYSIK